MQTQHNLNRFMEAQQASYTQALTETRNGSKQTHWMWYIFPQLAGLGFSQMAQYYAIANLVEAKEYLAHPILGSRLVEISQALLGVEGKTAHQIMGSLDDLKLKSSMTLFSLVEPTDPVFQQVLTKYYQAETDSKTLTLLGKNE